MLYKYVSYDVIFYNWMQKRLYHDISQRDLSFFHLIRKIWYVNILTLINFILNILQIWSIFKS